MVFVTGAKWVYTLRYFIVNWFWSPFSHGIGYTTVKHLARRGAKVYLGSRNEAKGLAAVASIEAELAKPSKNVTPGQVIYHHCELNTPREARESAEKFIERETRLDVLSMSPHLLLVILSFTSALVNNAGL